MSKEQAGVCAVCGRKARRNCSALDGFICNSCCGARRGARIDCPAECAHFPFGTAAYGMWLRVDTAWQSKALQYVIGKVGKNEFRIKAENCVPPWVKGDSAFFQGAAVALLQYLTVGKGDGTASIGEIWKREGWPGLNNDERYLAEYRSRSIPAILEVQKVLDDTAMECIDLLDTERGRFIVFDRSTASSVGRFAKMVVWITHYPHFTRLAGDGVRLPDRLCESFLSEIRRRAKKAMKSKSDETVKRYLAEHFVEAFELVEELSTAMREQMIASLDSDQCRAFYKLLAPRVEIESILEGKSDLELDDDRSLEPDDPPDVSYYQWLRRGEAKLIEKEARGLIQHGDEEEDGVGVLGSVRLTDDELIVEAKGRVLFEFAKKLTRSYFEKRLKLVKEETIPIEHLLEEHAASDREPGESPDGIPPEIKRQWMRKFYEKRYSGFLDEPVPMLDDMTPREASRIPSMRPKLMELVKLHIHGMDSMGKEEGFEIIDMNWIIDELGLDELK